HRCRGGAVLVPAGAHRTLPGSALPRAGAGPAVRPADAGVRAPLPRLPAVRRPVLLGGAAPDGGARAGRRTGPDCRRTGRVAAAPGSDVLVQRHFADRELHRPLVAHARTAARRRSGSARLIFFPDPAMNRRTVPVREDAEASPMSGIAAP